MDKSSGIHYRLIAIFLGLILFSGAISGSASVAFADNDDKKEKFKKLIELLKKFRERQNDDSHDDSNDDSHDDSNDDSHDDSNDDSNDNKKIKVCHIPPGNPNNPHTIKISKNDLQDHLDHGDTVGKCDKYKEKRDKKDPKIKITSPKKNKKVDGPSITVTGTAEDKGTGVETVMVRLDNGGYKTAILESDGTWTVEFTGVDDGKHKVTAKAVDFAGNDKRKHLKFKVI